MRRSVRQPPQERPIAIPTVLPVILCGGVGERLWPASRPGRSKPFIPLAGSSPLGSTLKRARAIASDSRDVVIVGAPSEAAHMEAEMARLGLRGQLLLEPEPRGTAAAVAAAAAWAGGVWPDDVLVIMPADHHLPDTDAFTRAVAAAVVAAGESAIGCLGVRPSAPSSAMGYVVPGDSGEVVGPIRTFVEKPEVARAAELIADGALWNAGIFIARADVLLEALRRHAPEIEAATSRAVKESRADGVRGWLGASFADAPIQSFDRAVMETTDRGVVLPVDFAWSDIGSWDAVLAVSSRDASGSSLEGDVQMREGHGMLVRAAPGVRVVVAGVEGLAVVAQPDAVLVCRLDQAPGLRGLGRSAPPPRFVDLPSASAALGTWLSTAALPLWGTVGVSEPSGLFVEAMTDAGAPHDPRCRTRVQARQVFVFASAKAEGRVGPWDSVGRRGLVAFQARMARPDGLFTTSITSEGEPLDAEARLYEHAFVLLALSALGEIAEGRRVLAALEVFRHPAGGFREAGERPFQANAHMHLLEAALAWETVDDHPAWRALADEIVALAMARFIAPDTGALSEFFDAEWMRPHGEAARVEPGHQFEWAWLLADWGRRRCDPRAEAVARGLYEAGRCGVDPRRGVAVNVLAPDLSLLDLGARLWPQTERLKAALSLGESEDALEAANTIAGFLETPVRGIWRERMFADGAFVDEPSPATSLYHLYQAIRELGRAAPVAC